MHIIPFYKSLNLPLMTAEEQKKDVFSACKLIPHLKVDINLFVEEEEKDNFFDDADDSEEKKEDEVAQSNSSAKSKKTYSYNPNISKNNEVIRGDDVYENDLITIRVTLTRENVEDGKNASPVHAPHFPRALSEAWWVILTTNPKPDKKNNVPEPVIHTVERLTDQVCKLYM